MYTREQVEKIAKESYMRGMMVQEETSKKLIRVRKTFNVWLKELIETI